MSIDDQLDAELRRLFADDRLDLRPRADAGGTIVSGARRVRRRRAVLTSGGGVMAVAVLVAGGVLLTGERHRPEVPLAEPPAPTQFSSQLPPAPVVPPGPTQSAPESSPAAPPHPSSPPEEVPSKKATPPPRSGKAPVYGPELEPVGYGRLRLGMSPEEAAASGVVLEGAGGEGCVTYKATSGTPSVASVIVSPNLGTVFIDPAGSVRTPKGIGTGSTREEVYAAYPGTSTGRGTDLHLVAPAGNGASFVMDLNTDGTVADLNLERNDQDCYG
ncbi:hypothetical protein [Amycolatopsis suaedae]|uniref:Uncharacterized protein n=1 Tax=Amycolatopsis suaedae TaxID=2510978 RepID=A0A4Q7J702_9PSEU|nr:hypothetical protein [Amycolatopsis suaedae]RZQ62113.1 hypothetical protein EWH70_21265 [Amycolatopsis suaedae]